MWADRCPSPASAPYSGTKFALEGLSEALADEVREYSIKVLIAEPVSFRTELFDATRAGTSTDSGQYPSVTAALAHLDQVRDDVLA